MQKQMRDPGNETVLYLSVVRSGWNHIPRSEQFFFLFSSWWGYTRQQEPDTLLSTTWIVGRFCCSIFRGDGVIATCREAFFSVTYVDIYFHLKMISLIHHPIDHANRFISGQFSRCAKCPMIVLCRITRRVFVIPSFLSASVSLESFYEQ